MRAPAFWWRPRLSPLARLLSPLGAIYGALATSRMTRRGEEVGIPVLCIGNVVAGGAGKTPTAIACAGRLKARGETPMFVSRGYGGRLSGKTPLRIDPARHTAADVGDEPLLLARTAPTFICVDRLAGARAAEACGASVIVLDDGLQNPALAKTRSLAVFDGRTGIGNGACLPAGPLRASLDAHWPLIHGVMIIGAGEAGERVAVAAAAVARPTFRGRLVPEARAAAAISGKRVFAFAGIGRPEKFFETVEGCGASIVGRKAFADHAAIGQAELDEVARKAKGADADLIVTTEKDACRLGATTLQNLIVLPVTLEVYEAEAFDDWLSGLWPAQPRG